MRQHDTARRAPALRATARRATARRATALLLGPLLALAGTLAVPGAASAATGSALTFGCDADGQLGNGAAGGSATPGEVLTGVQDVAGGREFSLALAGGTVYAWGDDSKGQVGNGLPLVDAQTPQAVLSGATAVATGHDHAHALLADGTVRAWGWNSRGQLGPAGGTSLKSPLPKAVSFPSRVVQVAGGRAHSIARLDDGSVWTWGDDLSGQLGLGGADNLRHPTPQQVPGLPPVAFVAGGRDSTFAVDTTGRLWAWGNNTYGQLGTGSTASTSTPVLVTSLSGVREVESGADHTVAVLADGTVQTWGRNRYGQLGTAGGTRTSPAVVPGLPAMAEVFVGRDHTIAVAGNGDTYTWGRNDAGQLGVAAPASSSRPMLVAALHGTLDAGGGQVHSIVLR